MDELARFLPWLWGATAISQVLLISLMIARKNAATYPAFCAYIVMTLAQSGLLFVANRVWGFDSRVTWRVGWATECAVLVARMLAVTELCRHVLERFRGIWLFARRILLALGATVLAYALVAANHQWRLMLNTAELGIELATASVIVALLLFGRYYNVVVTSPLRWMAIGLCGYSCVAALNDAILERWLSRYVPLWNVCGMVAFLACLHIWSWAFRKFAPQAATAPLFLDGSLYLNTIPEVNWRLRALNEQLIQFSRVEAPRP